MTRAVNDATLQKAGDIYQYLIALRDCFELNDGDSPAVEVVVKKAKKKSTLVIIFEKIFEKITRCDRCVTSPIS